MLAVVPFNVDEVLPLTLLFTSVEPLTVAEELAFTPALELTEPLVVSVVAEPLPVIAAAVVPVVADVPLIGWSVVVFVVDVLPFIWFAVDELAEALLLRLDVLEVVELDESVPALEEPFTCTEADPFKSLLLVLNDSDADKYVLPPKYLPS